MGPINTLPLGFLDLLGLQQQGRNLSEVAESVAAVIDLTPYYAAYKRTFAQQDTAFGAVTSQTQVVATVPNNEYWYIVGGTLACVSAAGATGRAGVQIQIEGRSLFSSDYVSVAAAQSGELTPLNFQTAIPIILPPGSVIIKGGYGFAGAGNEILNVRLVYLPLKG